MKAVTNILNLINQLSDTELKQLKSILLSSTFVNSINTEEFMTNERFAEGRVCPVCGSIHIVRNGRMPNGTQRFICRDCFRSFVITTNSIMSGTKKDLSVWEKYISCMINGMSIRKTANICRIHRNTAFYWRHKILDALQNMANDVKLNGIVEVDETFFTVSYKGNHKNSKNFIMPRVAHKRGGETHTRGISHEKVCVPCAVNRKGMSFARISNLGRVSTQNLNNLLDGRIVESATLVTDKMNSYVRFADKNDLNLVQLKNGKDKRGIYNIQHINNYHSRLKKFMRNFNGVSTKYLNNYLIWNNFVNYAKETDSEKQNILMRFALTTIKKETCAQVCQRESIPIVA